MLDQETLKLLAKKIALGLMGRGDLIEVYVVANNFDGKDYVDHMERDRVESVILDEIQCLARAALKSPIQEEERA